jgi:hypothetical protein
MGKKHLSKQFDSITNYGISDTAPEDFPNGKRPVFKEHFTKVIKQGTSQVDLANTKFFSRVQTDLNPNTVNMYRQAGTERKSEAWGEDIDPDYEHLEYPQLYMHKDTAEILDGHHRIAAALADKRPSIEAYVIKAKNK